MFKSLKLLIIFSFITGCSVKEDLRVSFTGDVILDRGVSDEIRLHGDTTLSNSISNVLNSDINIINLEGVFFRADRKLTNHYNFKTDPEKAQLLKDAGVSYVSVANNHSYDYGDDGFTSTICSLNDNGLIAIGDRCEPTIINRNGQKLAVIAASLFSNNSHLCIQSEADLKSYVKNFIRENPNVPLVAYLHWGLEYQPSSQLWQKKLARELIEEGVDAIIGHHPHVIQEIEMIDSKPVLYSLGNFVTDAYLPKTTTGLIANLHISDGTIITSLKPVDLSTYFPQPYDDREELLFFIDNAQYSRNIFFYRNENRWYFDQLPEIEFTKGNEVYVFSATSGYQLSLNKISNGNHLLNVWQYGKLINKMVVHGTLTDLKIGDINNDGEEELMLGIIKKVKFQPQAKKRLNIFKLEDGSLQPIWLGTHFMGDLISFDIIKKDKKNYLRVYEENEKSSFQSLYLWDEFGFALEETKPLYHEK